MQKNIGFSSETYHIHLDDLVRLPVNKEHQIHEFPNEILLMIGDKMKNVPDQIIRGNDLIAAAQISGKKFVPVRIILNNESSLFFNFLGAFSKPIRTKIEKYSQFHYRILLTDISENQLERNIKTEESAYNFTKKKWRLDDDQRGVRLEKLKYSFSKHGYDYNFPMQIMLCRSFGVKDQLQQGHHRMMLCKKHNIQVVSTIFMHSTFLPLITHSFLLGLMKLLRYKQMK